MDKISGVLIMRNEEKMLSRVLDSIKDAVDEIIICDTGSTDRSVEIAKQYTDKIYFRAWDDNFANARNFALSHATKDWILSIDCDEILHDAFALREAVALGIVYDLKAINVTMIADDATKQMFTFPRIFKRCPEVWWEGAIHNHPSVPGINVGGVQITHGYSPAHYNDPDRAYRILKKEVETHRRPRELFYFGRELYYHGELEEALKILGEYVQKTVQFNEKAEAFLIMAKCYWNLRMADDARDACAQAIILNAHFREAILLMAELAGDGTGNERFQANADQWKRLAATANNRDVLFVRT